MPEMLIRSVMRLYEGAKTRVRVDSELSAEFEVYMGMHQGPVLSPFYFAVVLDIDTQLAREAMLSDLLFFGDLVLISETIEALGNKFLIS